MPRPSTYQPKHGKLALALMAEGASKVEVAVALGISRDTFYRWIDKYPDFSDTIKDGEWLSQAWWEKQGRTNIANKQFNTALWYINMKNRFNWSDTVKITEQSDKPAKANLNAISAWAKSLKNDFVSTL